MNTKSKAEKLRDEEVSQAVPDTSNSPDLSPVKPVVAKKSKPIKDASLHGFKTTRKSKQKRQATNEELVMSGVQELTVPISQYEESGEGSLAKLVMEALNNSWMFTPTQ